MKTLFDQLRPEIHHRIAMLEHPYRDKIINIFQNNILFVDLKTIDVLYIERHLAVWGDLREIYRALFI